MSSYTLTFTAIDGSTRSGNILLTGTAMGADGNTYPTWKRDPNDPSTTFAAGPGTGWGGFLSDCSLYLFWSDNVGNWFDAGNQFATLANALTADQYGNITLATSGNGWLYKGNPGGVPSGYITWTYNP
jgi:hypothetical protein